MMIPSSGSAPVRAVRSEPRARARGLGSLARLVAATRSAIGAACNATPPPGPICATPPPDPNTAFRSDCQEATAVTNPSVSYAEPAEPGSRKRPENATRPGARKRSPGRPHAGPARARHGGIFGRALPMTRKALSRRVRIILGSVRASRGATTGRAGLGLVRDCTGRATGPTADDAGGRVEPGERAVRRQGIRALGVYTQGPSRPRVWGLAAACAAPVWDDILATRSAPALSAGTAEARADANVGLPVGVASSWPHIAAAFRSGPAGWSRRPAGRIGRHRSSHHAATGASPPPATGRGPNRTRAISAVAVGADEGI
jgi:hypothetical protein